ncbi:MAG: efflux RND transporter permease subunit [Myxococcota bacterium]
MSRVIAWFVHNPVAANLLMFVLLAGGMMALPLINQEEFPSIETDVVRVTVEYTGATPEEIERSICVRIEEEIEGVPNLKRVRSTSVEGVCAVTIEVVAGADVNDALAEVENRVDAIDTFPDEAEKPIVSKLVIRNTVIRAAIHGHTGERTLKLLGQQARDEIAGLPEVSQASLTHTRPYELSIEVSEETLRRHGITLDTIAAAVRRSSLDLPGGSVKTTDGEILLRTKGQAYQGEEFESIVVLTRNDGTSVRLGEIARVIDGFEDVDLSARFAGSPAAIVKVERIGDEDILDIAGAVKEWTVGFRERLPEGVEITLFNDASADLEVRLDALVGNARSGLFLVVAILALFLRFRLAMWVAAGVPISFLGAIMMFPSLDLSISTLTVMAFILVIGILVDDAIVIGESVYTREATAKNQTEAAILGTQEVYVPVIFGVMTTVAAFLPLVLAPGNMGRFFSVIGVTATICLFFSLIESQLILPCHLAHRRTESSAGEPNRFVARWMRFQGFMGNWLEQFAKERYGSALHRALEYRYVTAALALGLMIVTAALFSSGRMRYQFFPDVQGNDVFASLTLPQGTPLETARAAAKGLEDSAVEVAAGFESEYPDDPNPIVHMVSSIGEKLDRDGPGSFAVRSGGSHIIEVGLQLTTTTLRSFDAVEFANRWRTRAGAFPDQVELVFTSNAFSAGDAIGIELRGGSVATRTQAAAELRGRLASYKGVVDIADSFRGGKQEVQLALFPEARPLGLTLQDLARQVRQSFYGEEAQRIQRGQDDIKVMIRYPENERQSLGSLEEMRIRTGDGVEVPFAAVADAQLDRGFATIQRTDGQRVVTVTADVDRGVTTPERVLASVLKEMPSLLAGYPGVSYRLSGEQEENASALAGLLRGAVLALLLIYALLAIPLQSYSQPFVIMSVIPFGAVGAILGHLIMGWDLVFFSVLGIMALSGVVVNASLVLVHSVNRRRAEGLHTEDAVRSAGIARFRPIVLTCMTTFIGLVPLMFEAAPPAIPLIPMAISLGYGVLMSAVVTLFLVPAGYLILEDLTGSREESPAETLEDVRPLPVSARAIAD